eukprot:11207384-Lingulodinium_polyedra.AAC.1
MVLATGHSRHARGNSVQGKSGWSPAVRHGESNPAETKAIPVSHAHSPGARVDRRNKATAQPFS